MTDKQKNTWRDREDRVREREREREKERVGEWWTLIGHDSYVLL